jgi:hypothetical protein
MTSGEIRTRETVIVQLAKVNEGEMKTKREVLAKTNGSYNCEALVPIVFARICFVTLHICWESNPGPREGGTRAREKDCRCYDFQLVKWKEWILCSRGTRGNAESLKKQISSSPHFFKII